MWGNLEVTWSHLVFEQYRDVTPGQTDRRTDGRTELP